jgi:hypothetical protein
MARKDLERLVGRAVLDAEFRERLFADPDKALREEGFDLTDEEMTALKQVDRKKARKAAEGMAASTVEPWT